MKRWYLTAVLLCLLCSLAGASAGTVDTEAEKAWVRWLIPLPHRIEIKQETVLNPADIAIVLSPTAGDIEKNARTRLESLFREKTGAVPSGTKFEIAIGVLDAKGPFSSDALRAELAASPNSGQAYVIVPTGDNRLLITGLSPKGVFYGVETLSQLLAPFLTKDRVRLPLARVLDWPDFEERGIWNASHKVGWLASLKMNFLKLNGVLAPVKKDQKPSFAVDTKTLESLRLLAFNPVICFTHLNFLNQAGYGRVFEAYPELAGQGARALQTLNPHPDHRVPCATNPRFQQLLAEIMESLAERGINDFDVWLSEFTSQCECAACLKVGQMQAETNSVVGAWQQVRRKYPEFNIRIFFSITDEYKKTYEYLMKLPAEIKFEYVYGDKRIFNDCARSGRWVSDWMLPAGGGNAGEIKAALKPLHDGKWRAAYGYSATEFGATALAEWSWNLTGRNEREFLTALATRQGYDQPEKVAEWRAMNGPLAGFQYESRFAMRAVPGAARQKSKPSAYFSDAAAVNTYKENARKALTMAEDLGRPELVNESRKVLAYYRLMDSVRALLVAWRGADPTKPESQAALTSALAEFRKAADENISATEGKTEFGRKWADEIIAACTEKAN